MGLLTFEYKSEEFPDFNKLLKLFPVVSAQLLGYVGHEGKKELKFGLLSGQMLDYHGKWEDIAGRPKTSYRIQRGAKSVRISSYPANFFTVPNRRQKRRPVWGQLKVRMDSGMNTLLNNFDHWYFQKMLNEFEANPNPRTRY